MRYTEFEQIMSPARMSRYLNACEGNTKKAMTLYRLNLKLSQEMFTVISCFEVTLRNSINNCCLGKLGPDWLQNAAASGGIFDNPNCRLTSVNINEAISKLHANYTHSKLVAELGFGFWRYMFAQRQYSATGRILLATFPARPTSTPIAQYNNTYVFNQLADINDIRNRIAHHEPICFQNGHPIKSTAFARQHYLLIIKLLQWMGINEISLFYGLDHINNICNDIDAL